MNTKFENVDYWKAIILYGLNQATYKIALGKTLLELADDATTVTQSFKLADSVLNQATKGISDLINVPTLKNASSFLIKLKKVS